MENLVPTLNIQDFQSSDLKRQQHFVESLQRAFEDTGFVVIKGHTLSRDQQARAYKQIDAFFKLPLETKLKYEKKGSGGARGYTSFGKEHAKNHAVGDLKEFFHLGIKVPPGHALEKSYPPNVHVKELPGFNTELENLYTSLLELGMSMLQAIALILDLPKTYFDEKVRYGNSILRPIHYPKLQGNEDPLAIRSAPHEDINLITLLIGASSPGLQVKTRQGDWHAITTEAEEIVVNVGDMLQRLTNHRLKSTTHRVINPPAHRSLDSARYSMPFFLHPVSNMSLAALPSCITPESPSTDAPITAGAYLEQRLKEIGLL